MHHPNAGDVASAIVVSHILRRKLKVVGLEWQSGPNLLAIGSVLEWVDKGSVVWGSGFIRESSELPAVPKAVLAVRGELTRAKLNSYGIDCGSVLGDPGVFIPDIYPRGPVQFSLGLVPHYVDLETAFAERAHAAGLRIISPLLPFATYIRELTACERIISSSLHGLIFAHAYGIPAAWVELSDRVVGGGFKFRDYYTAVGVRGNDVPKYGADDDLTYIAENCHVPPGQIDKAALRDALLTRFHSVPWRDRLNAALRGTFTRNDRTMR